MASFYTDSVNIGNESIRVPSNGDETINISEVENYPQYLNKASGKSNYATLSMMNEHVAINYRTIFNGINVERKDGETLPIEDFTLYDDYVKCMQANDSYKKLLDDIKHPTVQKIIQYYGGEDGSLDPFGLSRYKAQDFIYCKYFNQVPLNQMITLRRYAQPPKDRMFGLDMSASVSNKENGYPDSNFAIATAVTYFGEETGNKLSSILKFSYGSNWEKKEGSVEVLQVPDGGLAAQLTKRNGPGGRGMISDWQLSSVGEGGMGRSSTSPVASMWASTWLTAAGTNTTEAAAAMNAYQGDAYAARYGDTYFDNMNVIKETMVRSRGITFAGDFDLVFEYQLKSYRFVNPRVAMLDILFNFMLLTGNYATFWGGMRRWWGPSGRIGPQFGDPNLLRQGRYGEYIKSLQKDVSAGFKKASTNPGTGQTDILGMIKNILKGGLENMLGNLLGGNIGVIGQGVVPKSLLSGEDTGFWHVTVGNPLNPIAVMGNMCIDSTDVEFGDVLGYDDFPSSIKFTVHLKHGKPRDNGAVESMFNAGKGRFYNFTDADTQNIIDQGVNNSIRNVFKDEGNASKTGKASPYSGTEKVASDTKKAYSVMRSKLTESVHLI